MLHLLFYQDASIPQALSLMAFLPKGLKFHLREATWGPLETQWGAPSSPCSSEQYVLQVVLLELLLNCEDIIHSFSIYLLNCTIMPIHLLIYLTAFSVMGSGDVGVSGAKKTGIARVGLAYAACVPGARATRVFCSFPKGRLIFF